MKQPIEILEFVLWMLLGAMIIIALAVLPYAIAWTIIEYL
jgi:hypothetical protein